MSSCCASLSSPPLRLPRRRSRSKPTTPPAFKPRASVSDPLVLEIAEKLEDSLPLSSPPLPLRRLRDASAQSLLSKPWPSVKDEPFRFTDLSFLKRSSVRPAAAPVPPPSSLPESHPSNLLTLIDGHIVPSLSRASLPDGAYLGGLSGLPAGPAFDRVLGVLSSGDGFRGGDLFWDLNGVGAPDVAIVYVPPGARVADEPVYLRFCAAEGSDVREEGLPLSNPRVMVVVEKDAEVAIVEEHLGTEGGEGRCYWANSVMEILIGEGGRVSHSYVQRQSLNAAHIKWTFARQESSSTYELIEISTGGRLSRHNLHIQQLGPDTVTELSAFHVSQSNQIQDLHSRLILDHPRGYSRQLHKCIVSHSSSQAVFDGNIKVNSIPGRAHLPLDTRVQFFDVQEFHSESLSLLLFHRFAQQTDAGQLTRSLLLAPRATTNVKPNLQIVADDVKCSHGAAISDLEEDQLFYFQARGVDSQTARDALLFSFGAEVMARIPYEPFRKSVTNQVKDLLASK